MVPLARSGSGTLGSNSMSLKGLKILTFRGLCGT